MTLPPCRRADRQVNPVDPTFCPDDRAPLPIKLDDGSTLVVADRAWQDHHRHDRVRHLKYTTRGGNRFATISRARLDVRSANALDVARELKHLLDQRQLVYVLRRGVLVPELNHAYVFRSMEPPHVVVAAESMWTPSAGKSAAFVDLHSPWAGRRPGVAPGERTCPDCGELHVRVVLTFYALTSPDKMSFLSGRGPATQGRGFLFDPAKHSEYFVALPEAWDVDVRGGVVSVTGPSGAVQWEDDELRLPGQGPCRIGTLGRQETERIAAGYGRARGRA